MKSLHTVNVIGKASYDSLLAECLRDSQEDEIPVGGISASDLMRESNGMSRSKADGILRRKEQAGLLRSIRCRRRQDGKMRVITYYVRKESP